MLRYIKKMILSCPIMLQCEVKWVLSRKKSTDDYGRIGVPIN